MGVPTPGQISYFPFLEVKGLSVPLLLELEIASARSSYSPSAPYPFSHVDVIILLHSFGRILMIFLL